MDDPEATADLLCELQGAWRFANLVYCPVTDDDVAFLDTLNADPVTFCMGGGALVRPQGKETAKGLAALLAKSYLAVMICLPEPAGITSTTSPTADDADDDNNNDPPAPPERIGYVALGLGGDHPTWPSNHNRGQALSITLAPAPGPRDRGASVGAALGVPLRQPAPGRAVRVEVQPGRSRGLRAGRVRRRGPAARGRLRGRAVLGPAAVLGVEAGAAGGEREQVDLRKGRVEGAVVAW